MFAYDRRCAGTARAQRHNAKNAMAHIIIKRGVRSASSNVARLNAHRARSSLYCALRGSMSNKRQKAHINNVGNGISQLAAA